MPEIDEVEGYWVQQLFKHSEEDQWGAVRLASMDYLTVEQWRRGLDAWIANDPRPQLAEAQPC